MSRCGDQNDIFVYVLNVFIGIAIAVYFLPCKKITLYISRNSLRASRSLVINVAFQQFSIGPRLGIQMLTVVRDQHEGQKTNWC